MMKEAQIDWSIMTCKEKGSIIRYWNYFILKTTLTEDYRACAGGLSAVNAIGRDPINSGPRPVGVWRYLYLIGAAAEIARPNSQARTTQTGKIHFPCSTDHVQD